MKKCLAILFTVILVISSLTMSVSGSTSVNVQAEMLEINGIFIPTTAKCVQEASATVYYDFYDSVNHMHYSFFNVQTGEHFAMSDPIYVDNGNGTRNRSYVAHRYSFNSRYVVNGKDNGITFELPSQTVYIRGNAEIIQTSTGNIVTDQYNGAYEYTIEIREDVLLFPQSIQYTYIAGTTRTEYFTADGGTYYLIINPKDRMEDWHHIEGEGVLFYYA